MFCPQCGNEMTDGARFCPQCGRDVKATAASGVPAPPLPPSSSAPFAARKKWIVPAAIAAAALLAFACVGVAFGVGAIKAPWAQDDPLIGMWTLSDPSGSGQAVSLDVKPDGKVGLSLDIGVGGGKIMGLPASVADLENAVSDITWSHVGDEGDCRLYEFKYTGSGIEIDGVNYGDFGLSQVVLTVTVPKGLDKREATGTWGVEVEGLDSLGVLAAAMSSDDPPSSIGGTCKLMSSGACDLTVQVDGGVQVIDSSTFTWVSTGTSDAPGVEVRSRYSDVPLVISFAPEAV